MKKFIYFLTALILLFNCRVFGQVTIGKLTPPDSSAVLQIISPGSNKGVLFPYLTSGQRDNIFNPADGLMIYNLEDKSFNVFNGITNHWESIAVPAMNTVDRDSIPNPTVGQSIYNLDESCVDTWNGSEWFSICGSTPVAQASITNCSAIAVGGSYIAGTSLTTGNYLAIPVTVTSKKGGTYNILATTGNGYFFTAQGTFPGPGTYNVNAMGAGAPTSATTAGDPGDQVTITINNIEQTCTPYVKILPATPDYTIVGVNVFPTVKYLPGTPIDSTINYLMVMLNVKVPGQWNLYAASVNGYNFAAQGNISSNGTYPQIVNVIVPAEGMPENAGSTDNFILTNPGSATPSNYPFTVYTASVSYSANCGTAAFSGSLRQGKPIAGSEYITLPVKVSVLGEVPQGITASGAGLSFSSGPLNFTKLGDTVVTLKPNGNSAPTASGTVHFTLTGDGLTSNCSVPVDVMPGIATFTFVSASYKNATQFGADDGRWVMTKSINPLDSINHETPQNIMLTVNVSGTNYGSYNITTDSANGVSYSASGTISAPGTYQILLKPTGEPTKLGTVQYTLSGNGMDGNNVYMSYSYRQFNVLAYTANTGYGFNNNPQANAILGGTGTFGPGGIVPCAASPNVNGNAGSTGPATAAALASEINSKKIDILYLGYNVYNTIPDADIIKVIQDFVFNKHGILIWTNEYAPGANGGASRLINALFNTSLTTAVNGTVGLAYNGSFTSNTSEIIQGPFGNLTGMTQTVTAGNAGFVSATNTIPNSIILSTTCSQNLPAYSNQILSLQNSTLGVYMSMDNTFRGNGNTMPATSYDATTGVPKMPSAGCSGTANSHNSLLFANIFAWALHYGAYNIDPGYQVSASPAAGVAYPSSFVPRK